MYMYIYIYIQQIAAKDQGPKLRYATGDTISIYLDIEAREMRVGKNGVKLDGVIRDVVDVAYQEKVERARIAGMVCVYIYVCLSACMVCTRCCGRGVSGEDSESKDGWHGTGACKIIAQRATVSNGLFFSVAGYCL